MGFLNNEESKSCLSCMWNIYWSSSLSLPNIKAIHWRIKVTYNFENSCRDLAIIKDGFKNLSKKEYTYKFSKLQVINKLWYGKIFFILKS